MLCVCRQDSLIQTVKQVQAAFETLLDILQLQTQVQSSRAHRQTAASELQTFLRSTSSRLLAIGQHAFLHRPVSVTHSSLDCTLMIVCIQGLVHHIAFIIHSSKPSSYACNLSSCGENLYTCCDLRLFRLVTPTATACCSARCGVSSGSHRKGRYIPLATLVTRVGAKQMLSLQPDLLHQVHPKLYRKFRLLRQNC